jgi:hypothetical protein
MIIGPTLFLQLLVDRSERIELFRWVARNLAADGVAAFAVSPDLAALQPDAVLPETDLSDRCCFGSTCLRSTISNLNLCDGVFEIRRSRLADGIEIEATVERLAAVSVEQICAEALSVGLSVKRTVEVPPSSRHAGVTVLVFDAQI